MTAEALALILVAAAVAAWRTWVVLLQAALLAASEATARRRAAAGELAALVLSRLLDDAGFPGALLLAAQAALLLVSALLTLASRLAPEALPALPTLAVALAALLVAELVARLYGRMEADRLAFRYAGSFNRLERLLAPVARPLLRVCLGLVGADGCELRRPGSLVTAADIQVAADLSEASGQVEPEVGRMLDEVMELTTTTVHEIMTPRVDIEGVRAEATPEAIMETAIASGFSRLPVYEGDLDNIVGLLHVNDLIAWLARGEHDFTARQVARPAVRTPETKRVNEMLREMRESANHLAIVVDQSGGTAGLLTIEDIVEELVGEIRDEHDTAEEEIELVAPGELLVEGKARLEAVGEALEVELPAAEADTVSGLLAWLLGRIPREGESISFGGLRFVVEEEEGQYVRQVRVIRLTGEGE